MSLVGIFITGATGYIGGGILAALLAHPSLRTFAITALVRDASKAAKLRELGVNAVVGSHNDAPLVTPLVENADIVIAAADADDIDACEAILAGMRRRHERTGKRPVLIHTSGTGVLADQARGQHPSSVIYSDLDLPLLSSLPRSQPHREVDLAVQAADAAGYARTYVIAPSTIYGRARGVLVERGISNPKSQQIPRLIGISLRRGEPAMMGGGLNLWENVHIDDLTKLYVLILDKSLSHTPPPSGAEGFFFGANGEHRVLDVAERIGRAMSELGKGRSSRPTPFTEEEIEEWFGSGSQGLANCNASYGSNARARADRGYALGWKPTKSAKDMLASIRPEMEAVLAEG